VIVRPPDHTACGRAAAGPLIAEPMWILHHRGRVARPVLIATIAASVALTTAQAQVSAYTFSQHVGAWQPIAGTGTPLGLAGLPAPWNIDDDAFVVQGQNMPLGPVTTGNGWPIGFPFTFNGIQFDRVGFSTEGWLALGRSADGDQAVYVPIGASAYTPLSSAVPAALDPVKRHRIVGFAGDLMAGGGASSWPIQFKTEGVAPHRQFVVEFNLTRSGGGGSFSFQIRLHEGGGDPAQQLVQVVFGPMTSPTPFSGQVGLGGMTPSDFNSRSVQVAPYDWTASDPGTTNSASCRVPTSADMLPQGLTWTWTPAACLVTGITLGQLSFNGGALSGVLTWEPVPAASSYDVRVTLGGPEDPPVFAISGVSQTTIELTDLPANADLRIYVRGDCAEGWGQPLHFATGSVVHVACGQPPVQATHCYANLEQRTWTYLNTTGDPLRLVFQEGALSTGDEITIHDGPSVNDPVLYAALNTSVAGYTVTSTGGAITMRLSADHLGSCEDNSWVMPLEWEVGCMDCDPILASFSVVNDCPNNAFQVEVAIFSMGSASEVVIGHDAGAGVVTATTPGSYLVGPFALDVPVVVTAGDPVNAFCSAVSTPLVNSPCPVLSCGPDTYTHCYANGENAQWVYSSENGERLGMLFTAGSVAPGDHVRVYDGEDVFTAQLLYAAQGADLAGVQVLSSAQSNTLLLELVANNAESCATGQADPLTYVVACYEECEAPQAQFSVVDDCGQGQFSILVEVTAMGSANSLVIRDGEGLQLGMVTAPGTQVIGPFPVGAMVSVQLDGEGAFCDLLSPVLTDGCVLGTTELPGGGVSVHPNPVKGEVRVRLPRHMVGDVRMTVHDLSGRTVVDERVLDRHVGDPVVDLGRLSAGSYVLVLRDAARTYSCVLQVID
jgi:hypothetical protein